MSRPVSHIQNGTLEEILPDANTVFGRENEARQLLEYLCHAKSCNVLLVGPCGSGRTSVVRALVQQHLHQVTPAPRPITLARKTVYHLDGRRVASGEISSRVVKSLLSSVIDGILFISHGADMFTKFSLEAVAQGNMQLIVSCVASRVNSCFKELPTCIQHCFQRLDIAALDVATTRLAMHSAQALLESRHGLKIPHGVLDDVATLCDRIVDDAMHVMPGKAFHLLAGVCAFRKAQDTVGDGEELQLKQRIAMLRLKLPTLTQEASSNVEIMKLLKKNKERLEKQRQAGPKETNPEQHMEHPIANDMEDSSDEDEDEDDTNEDDTNKEEKKEEQETTSSSVMEQASPPSSATVNNDLADMEIEIETLDTVLTRPIKSSCESVLGTAAVQAELADCCQNLEDIQSKLCNSRHNHAKRKEELALSCREARTAAEHTTAVRIAAKKAWDEAKVEDDNDAMALQATFGVHDRDWVRASMLAARIPIPQLVQSKAAFDAASNAEASACDTLIQAMRLCVEHGEWAKSSSLTRCDVLDHVERHSGASMVRLLRVINDRDPECKADDTSSPMSATKVTAASSLSLAERLRARVVGQDEAIDVICTAIARHEAGLSKENHPIAGVFFAGLTGTGKTELAKALAVEMFDSEKALVRFDMSEFQEAHSISRLIGSPPGYIGADDGGQLTNAILARPRAVVLFDEIEKAHPKLCTLFLQILDDARLTSAQGTTVCFRNTIVIFTSNIGSGAMSNFVREHYQKSSLNAPGSSITQDASQTCCLKEMLHMSSQSSSNDAESMSTQSSNRKRRRGSSASSNDQVEDDAEIWLAKRVVDRQQLGDLLKKSSKFDAKRLCHILAACASAGSTTLQMQQVLGCALLPLMVDLSSEHQPSHLCSESTTITLEPDTPTRTADAVSSSTSSNSSSSDLNVESLATSTSLASPMTKSLPQNKQDHSVCWAQIKDIVRAEIREKFPPEFLNRFEDIVIFNPLTIPDKADGNDPLSKIVQLLFNNISQRLLSMRNINLTLSPCAALHIIHEAYDPQYGARPVLRYMEKRIVSQLSEDILSKKIHSGMHVTIRKDPTVARLDFVHESVVVS